MKWLKLAEEEFCNEPDGARIALNSIEQRPRARLYSRKHIFFEKCCRTHVQQISNMDTPVSPSVQLFPKNEIWILAGHVHDTNGHK